MSPIPVRPREWKMPAAMISIAMLTSPAIVIAITTSICSKRKMRLRSLGVGADDAPLRQRGVQVDHVRHHGGAEDARGQQHALGVGELRRQRPLSAALPSGCACRISKTNAGDDDAHEHRDDRLEVTHAAQLGAQDRERDDAGEQAGGQERQAEEQVEAERGAHELREVAGHRDRLGLQPEEDAHRVARTARRLTSARLSPVAMPSFALIVWISIAMRFETRMTQSSR